MYNVLGYWILRSDLWGLEGDLSFEFDTLFTKNCTNDNGCYPCYTFIINICLVPSNFRCIRLPSEDVSTFGGSTLYPLSTLFERSSMSDLQLPKLVPSNPLLKKSSLKFDHKFLVDGQALLTDNCEGSFEV